MTKQTKKEVVDVHRKEFFNQEWRAIESGSDDSYQRLVGDDEIVIEFDYPRNMALENCRKMSWNFVNQFEKKIAGKYNYEIWDHGGKSPHIHIKNIKGLKELPPELRLAYKESFLKKYLSREAFKRADEGFYMKQRVLIQKENKPHYKIELDQAPYHEKRLVRNE